MSGQWSPERSAQGAVAQTYATYFKRPQRRAGRSGGHPKGAPTSVHLLCCRLLTYAGYVREPTPRIWTLVDALTTHF